MYSSSYRFRRRIQVIGSVAFNILQLISALLSIITTSVGVVLLAWFFHLQNWIIPLSAFILGISVTLVLLIFFVWRSSPPRWLLRGYRQVQWEALYTICENDPKHHTFTNTVEIEAIRPGVNLFEDTYQWTGRGQEGIPKVLSSGHSLIGNVMQRSAWNYYYVYLGRDLNVGEKTELKIVQDLYDAEDKFQPFLAKVISQPVDNLTLRVVLPRNNLASHVNFTEYDTVGPASRLVHDISGKINNQNGEICWKILRPVFGHRYEISWGY